MDYFNISGQVAIVTGASRGLVRLISLGYGEAGAKVVCVSRSKDAIEETAAMITDKGGEAIAIPCDIKDSKDIESMVELTIKKYERRGCLACGLSDPSRLNGMQELFKHTRSDGTV